MKAPIKIWLIGNTGLRNPYRIHDGFAVFANSPYVGNLRGKDNEIAFMRLLHEKGIIKNEQGKDISGSHARKWRLAFAKNGLIYPQISNQEKLGTLDGITPFGKIFLKADSYSAIRECFLRAMSVEQMKVPETSLLFSPLRWILAIMVELHKRTGSSELTRLEFALWGQATSPRDNINEVVNNILDLRERRTKSRSKKKFDHNEIQKRAANYDKKQSNFREYADMNMRYLCISDVLQRKGRGLIISSTKHIIAEQMAKSTGSTAQLIDQFKLLCNGAPIPTDNIDTARKSLEDLISQIKDRHIPFNISDLSRNSLEEINIARHRLENILAENNEVQYARDQRNLWKEIRDYMTLLIKGGGSHKYDEDNIIEIPKGEAPAYLEWTLWRAVLAIDHLSNLPYEVRGFKLDSDFMPISTAGGGKGDLYCEFKDFTILTEVTMSTSSRQEAMEGEPVRRHVFEATTKYKKPVYGLFVCIGIDTNTVETFRHAVWYGKDDSKHDLIIIPLTLAQFQKYFESMFKANKADPYRLRDLILLCEANKATMEAPEWKRHIDKIVEDMSSELCKSARKKYL